MSSIITQVIDSQVYTEKDLACIDFKNVPKHVAIVMDGNRRWAEKEGKPVAVGHCYGAEKLDFIVRAASELGIKALTVYSFSTENWGRSRFEVNALMRLLEAYLVNKRKALVKEGVCLHAIGDLEGLPANVRKALSDTMQITKDNNQIDLILALNYGGRDELRRTFRRIYDAIEKGSLDVEDVTEETISSYLDTAQWGDPELLIRPSGEFRLSNFLNWQLSYTEIYMTDILWPDFSENDLLQAVVEYQKRSRRFGG